MQREQNDKEHSIWFLEMSEMDQFEETEESEDQSEE